MIYFHYLWIIVHLALLLVSLGLTFTSFFFGCLLLADFEWKPGIILIATGILAAPLVPITATWCFP